MKITKKMTRLFNRYARVYKSFDRALTRIAGTWAFRDRYDAHDFAYVVQENTDGRVLGVVEKSDAIGPDAYAVYLG